MNKSSHNNKEDQDALNINFTELSVADFKHFCELCGLKFLTNNSMLYHKKIQHRIGFKAMSKCKVCRMEVKPKKMRKHMNTHGEGATDCKLCYKTFRNTYSLKCHEIKSHKGEKEYLNIEITEDILKFKCIKCVNKFVSYGILEQHMNHQHGTECKLCYRNLSNVHKMPRHMKFAHKDDLEFMDKDITDSDLKYPCNICNRRFVKDTLLISHKREHKLEKYKDLKVECYRKDKKNYKCKFCYAIYSSFIGKLNLLDHILSKHKADSNLFNVKITRKECEHKCEKCDYKFISENALLCHTETVHHNIRFPSINTSGEFFCKLCLRPFGRMRYYQQHVQNIHKTVEEQEALNKDTIAKEDLVHSCNQCSDMFLTNNILSYHLRYKHKNVKDKKCKLCHREFKDSAKYQEHIHNIHKKFKEEMDIIVALENGEIALEQLDLEHTCTHCNETFLNLNILKYHIRYKHGSMLDKLSKSCKLCQRDFRDNMKYKEHIRNVHRKFKEEMNAIVALEHGKLAPEELNLEHTCNQCNEMFLTKTYPGISYKVQTWQYDGYLET